MDQWVVLNLGSGNYQQGFPMVIAQLWHPDRPTPIQFTGSLPPAEDLIQLYREWQQLYTNLDAGFGLRRPSTRSLDLSSPFEFEESDLTHVSKADFAQLSREIQTQLNQWLNAPGFRNIERKLRTYLNPTEEVRFIITAADGQMLRLPWVLWQFLEDYPLIEIALSPPDYAHALKQTSPSHPRPVKILAILGDRQGIDISQDQRLLEQLPDVDLTFLVEPDAAVLNQHLWETGWDVLFFAGHSSSQQQQGMIQINPRDQLTIGQLKYGLKKAIAHGLKLAIFNSCDGLGLALDLADLHLPQMIVMREPVPDRVAQEFLKHFLSAFSGGQSLYHAVREAREKLQILESEFPCATWLPVICQNPADVPTHWRDWQGVAPNPRWIWPTRKQWQVLLLQSGLIASLVMVGRAFGLTQGLELTAYDQFLRLRPVRESADPRIVVVTINEADERNQGNEPRNGTTLSEKTVKRLLTVLEQAKPNVVGLDLYRDFPATDPELAQKLRQSDRLIAVCKRPDTQSGEGTREAVLPPPELPPERVGFSDFVEDADGVVRRHLIAMPIKTTSSCTPFYAFNTELAFRYLRSRGVTAELTPQDNIRLGQKTIPRLVTQAGGYEAADLAGVQLLLNYRTNPQNVATQVSLTQLLKGQIDPSALQDRIVLVGTISRDKGDYWQTPYGRRFDDQLPGVLLQAQMVSQLLSAALDGRSLLWVWHPGMEWLWVWSGSAIVAFLTWRFKDLRLRLLIWGGSGLVVLVGSGVLLIGSGGWMPLVPFLLSMEITGVTVSYTLSVLKLI